MPGKGELLPLSGPGWQEEPGPAEDKTAQDAESGPGPVAHRRPTWPLGLAGAGLFLAGMALGSILAVAVVLYREPAGSLSVPSPLFPTPNEGTPAPARGEDRSGDMRPTPPPSSLPATPTAVPVGPKAGWEAPDFTLAGLDGETYTLSAFRGRTVLLHFWASWCLPCRTEWPDLRAFAERHEQVLLLAVNSEQPAEVVRDFLGQEGAPFPILLDGDGRVGRTYRLSALPTTFLIGPDGIIRYVVPGNVGAEGLEDLIER